MDGRTTLSTLILALILSDAVSAEPRLHRVRSKDGAMIAVECAGSGPELLIVHGGIGDRNRWTPMFPYLARDFTVCAMDRRGHGTSVDGTAYSLRKEAEDVAAVVKSRHRPVAVLGHSYGGVAAYEAAFLGPRFSALILYEPPLQDPDHSVATAAIEALISSGDREAATVAFLRDVVRISPEAQAAARSGPGWASFVASVDTLVRQDRALAVYRWDAERARRLRIPTLLIRGEKTPAPELRRAVESLAAVLPDRQVVVLQGQEHNAMDTDRERLAAVIREFLGKRRGSPASG